MALEPSNRRFCTRLAEKEAKKLGLNGGFVQFLKERSDVSIENAFEEYLHKNNERCFAAHTTIATKFLQASRIVYNHLKIEDRARFDEKARKEFLIQRAASNDDEDSSMPLVEIRLVDETTKLLHARTQLHLQRQLTCGICAKFSRNLTPLFNVKDLISHMWYHHGSMNVFGCHFCELCFLTKAELRSHDCNEYRHFIGQRMIANLNYEETMTVCNSFLACVQCGIHMQLSYAKTVGDDARKQWNEIIEFYNYHSSDCVLLLQINSEEELTQAPILSFVSSLGKEFLYSCVECKIESFLSDDDLEKHFIDSHPSCCYKCPDKSCQFITASPYKTRLHVLTKHIPNGIAGYYLSHVIPLQIKDLRLSNASAYVGENYLDHEDVLIGETSFETTRSESWKDTSYLNIDEAITNKNGTEKRKGHDLLRQLEKVCGKKLKVPECCELSEFVWKSGEDGDEMFEFNADDWEPVEGLSAADSDHQVDSVVRQLQHTFTLSCETPRTLKYCYRIFSCLKCNAICNGVKATRRHLEVCCNINQTDELDLDTSELVHTIFRGQSYPNSRLVCRKCGEKCCSIDGLRLHLYLKHDKLCQIHEDESDSSWESVPDFSSNTRFINKIIGLTEDGRLPNDPARSIEIVELDDDSVLDTKSTRVVADVQADNSVEILTESLVVQSSESVEIIHVDQQPNIAQGSATPESNTRSKTPLSIEGDSPAQVQRDRMKSIGEATSLWAESRNSVDEEFLNEDEPCTSKEGNKTPTFDQTQDDIRIVDELMKRPLPSVICLESHNLVSVREEEDRSPDAVMQNATVVEEDDDDILVMEELGRTALKTEPMEVEQVVTELNEGDDECCAVAQVETKGTAVPVATREKKFKCSKCTEAFITKASRDRHEADAHQQDMSSELYSNIYGLPLTGMFWVCRSCSAAFESKDVYDKHRNRHTEHKHDQSGCEWCSGTMLNENDIPKHYDRHLNKRFNYTCTLCTPHMWTHDEGVLMMHMAHHHEMKIMVYCKTCLLGTCDMTANFFSHALRCRHYVDFNKENPVNLIGAVAASNVMFQPTNEEQYNAILKSNPSGFVKPSECTHLSFIRFVDSYAICPENPDCMGLLAHQSYNAWIESKNDGILPKVSTKTLENVMSIYDYLINKGKDEHFARQAAPTQATSVNARFQQPAPPRQYQSMYAAAPSHRSTGNCELCLTHNNQLVSFEYAPQRQIIEMIRRAAIPQFDNAYKNGKKILHFCSNCITEMNRIRTLRWVPQAQPVHNLQQPQRPMVRPNGPTPPPVASSSVIPFQPLAPPIRVQMGECILCFAQTGVTKQKPQWSMVKISPEVFKHWRWMLLYQCEQYTNNGSHIVTTFTNMFNQNHTMICCAHFSPLALEIYNGVVKLRNPRSNFPLLNLGAMASKEFKTAHDNFKHVLDHNANLTCIYLAQMLSNLATFAFCAFENCRRRLTTSYDFFIHNKFHRIEAKQFCNICLKIVPDGPDSDSLYLQHCISHHNLSKSFGLNFMLQCPFCATTEQSLLFLRVHINKEHRDVLPFPANACASRFGTDAAQIAHDSQHQTTKQETCCYLCGVMDTTVRIGQEDWPHIFLHSITKSTFCNVCFEVVPDRGIEADFRLVDHFMKSHCLQSAVILCKVCNQSYTNMHFRQHVLTKHKLLSSCVLVENDRTRIARGHDFKGYTCPVRGN